MFDANSATSQLPSKHSDCELNRTCAGFFWNDAFTAIYTNPEHTLRQQIHNISDEYRLQCNVLSALITEPQFSIFAFNEPGTQKLLRRLFEKHRVPLVCGCWIAKRDSARLMDVSERDEQLRTDFIFANEQLRHDFLIPNSAIWCPTTERVDHIIVVLAVAAARDHHLAADIIYALCDFGYPEILWEMMPIACLLPRGDIRLCRKPKPGSLLMAVSTALGEGNSNVREILEVTIAMTSNRQALHAHAKRRRAYHHRLLHARRRAADINASRMREIVVPSDECCICLDAVSALKFVPCGHLATCRDCGASLETCPLCRVEITSVEYRDDQKKSIPLVQSKPRPNGKNRKKRNKRKKARRKNKF